MNGTEMVQYNVIIRCEIKQKAIFTPVDAFVLHFPVAFLLCWSDVEIHFSSTA